jgi:hypothetical protein
MKDEERLNMELQMNNTGTWKGDNIDGTWSVCTGII